MGSYAIMLRPAGADDGAAIWSILEPVFRGGETYPLPREISRKDALAYWFGDGHEVFIAELNGRIAGTYYLRANTRGGGGHVANGGYAVAADAGGLGVGRTMCMDSLDRARERGFTAMQFNFVIASNKRAVHLWKSCGFEIAGTLPGAFDHPVHGFVDAYVMYRSL